jgi:hypothetical protein
MLPETRTALFGTSIWLLPCRTASFSTDSRYTVPELPYPLVLTLTPGYRERGNCLVRKRTIEPG